MEDPKFSIVGCGRVGVTLARMLKQKGYSLLGVSSRTQASVNNAVKVLDADRASLTPKDVTKEADLVFITTPDDVIEPVCSHIADNNGFKEGAIVLHCSGSQPSTILSAATRCGAVIGSVHPLQSIAAITLDSNPFDGIITAVEGEPEAVKLGKQISRDIGSTCIEIKTHAKSLYHASAVVASNYLVTLIDAACKLMACSGVDPKSGYQVLKPLLKGSFDNIDRMGIPGALTGPIARGDHNVVKTHLEEIGKQAPELLDFYKTLGYYTIDISQAKNGITPEAAQVFKSMLAPDQA
ncbi:MAG TPA: DUF2520 domain-containing protein [Desulfobacteraceae bacterium]|nr:DUF2520 domain-containing protein [Desulfobacteraceae bacterium]|tara:strand:+ start:473 stop:1357 length:885 start_codon:yes stop_codon:yes gene_type:complete